MTPRPRPSLLGVRRFFQEMGIKGIALVVLISVLGSLIIFLILLPELGADTTPTSDDTNIDVIAKSGVDGFPVDLFCNDPLTRVIPFPAPDASGTTYQLMRVREGVTETVVVVFDPTGHEIVPAKHFYDTSIGQDSEPAIVNEDARKCIERKARP